MTNFGLDLGLGLKHAARQAGAMSVPAGLANAKASNTTKLRSSFAAVQAGTGRARHLFVGNSLEAGLSYSEQLLSNAAAHSAATAYAQALSAAGYPASWQSWIGGQGEEDFNGHDNRIVISGGANAGLGTLGSNTIKLETSGSYLTFSPTGNVDRVEILMIRGGGGVVDVTNDGSASVGTWGASSGTGKVNKSSAIALNGAAGTKVIRLTRSSGTSFVAGMIAYESAVASIDVLRAGWSGSIAGFYNGDWSANDGIRALGADFVSIALTRNDANSGTAQSDFKSAYRLIIEAALANSATVLLVVEPLGNLTLSTQETYGGYVSDLAAEYDIPFWDYNRTLQPYASYSGWYGDGVHLVRARYQDFGVAKQQVFAHMLAL